jgi:hypothetical protein
MPKKTATSGYAAAKLIVRMVQSEVLMGRLRVWTAEECLALTGSRLGDKKLEKAEEMFLRKIDKIYQGALKLVHDFEKARKALAARDEHEEDDGDAETAGGDAY